MFWSYLNRLCDILLYTLYDICLKFTNFLLGEDVEDAHLPVEIQHDIFSNLSLYDIGQIFTLSRRTLPLVQSEFIKKVNAVNVRNNITIMNHKIKNNL